MPVPVAAGRSGVTVSTDEVPPLPAPPPPPPPPPDVGAGPIAVTVPGVLPSVGSTIEVGSPTLTIGIDGLTGTVTVLIAVVTW